MYSFWQELKRRNVVKVAVAYLALGWIIVQVTSLAVPALNLPTSLNSIVFYLGLVGFPFALFLAWAYELTPEGVKKTESVGLDQSLTPLTGRKIDFIIIALLVCALLFVIFARDSTRSDEPPKDAGSSALSIAVLPFINMSAISENAFFAAGIHEEVLTNLSFLKGLRVSSRTSTLQYAHENQSIRKIGQDLGVRYIVEGSVRRLDNHVRVTAQLIDAHTDSHLWANNYDRELIDVFAVQSAIAKAISDSIHLQIQPDTVGKLKDMPTDSVKAYDLYLKAQSIEASERESPDSLERTKKLLEQAVIEDPDYVEAWGLLNEICDHMLRNLYIFDWFGGRNNQARIDALSRQSKQALDKAVSLDPDNLETLLAQASDFVAEEASAEFSKNRRQYIDRAIELYPDAAMPWYVLAWWYRLEDNLSQADKSFRIAIEKDPFHARILSGTLVFYSNNIELDPDHSLTNILFERLQNSVGGVSSLDKIIQLASVFFKTADESVFGEILAKEGPQLAVKLNWHMADLVSIFQTPMHFVQELEDSVQLSADTKTGERDRYFATQHILLLNYMQQQNKEKMEKIARRILALEKMPGPDGWKAYIDSLRVPALVAMGEEQQAQELVLSIISRRSESYDPYGYSGIFAMSFVDADKGVAMLMAENEKGRLPWMDFLPVDIISHSRLLTHPKVIAYYQSHPKWLNYLKKRLPAYSDMKISSAN